jgi:hypothetical protein
VRGTGQDISSPVQIPNHDFNHMRVDHKAFSIHQQKELQSRETQSNEKGWDLGL